MKHLIKMLLIFSVVTGVTAQENVAFYHGILSDGNTWTSSKYNMIENLKKSNYINTLKPTRDDKVSFSVQADAVKTSLGTGPNNYIAVGHSMGGLATRTYLKKYSSEAKINRLITLGSPHKGAQIAESVYNNRLNDYIYDQSAAIVDSPARLLAFGVDIFADWFKTTIQSIRELVFITGYPSKFVANSAMNDLRPNSSGFQYLDNYTETYNRVGIIGRELDQKHEFYRLAFTFLTGDPEDGNKTQDMLVSTYKAANVLCLSIALSYAYDGYDDDAEIMIDIADDFLQDAATIQSSGWKWKKWVNGSFYKVYGFYKYGYSDGVVPEFSQTYLNANKLPTYINGTNHLLETKSDKGKVAIEDGFNKVGFRRDPFPLAVSISPTSASTPPGGAYTFYASVSGGTGNFNIEWYYFYPGPVEMKAQEVYVNAIGPTNGWKYLRSGSSTSFQPVVKNQLKAVVTDLGTGLKTEAIIYW